MKRYLLFFLLLFFPCLNSFSEVLSYKSPVLLARANISDGYQLPAMSFLSNTSPVINNSGDVSFKIMSIGGQDQQGLWVKNKAKPLGEIIYTAPESRLLSDPSLNNSGLITFNQYDEGVTDGVFTFDGIHQKLTQVINPENKNILYYTYSQTNSNGVTIFRGTSEDNLRSFYSYEKNLSLLIAEDDSTDSQKTSYLFKPSLNENGAISFKRRLGERGEWSESQGDEILLLRRVSGHYERVSIAQDKDLNQNSNFLSFYNSTSLSNNGKVAFSAMLLDSKKAIMLWENEALLTLAVEGQDDLGEIELFSPVVNDQGLVAFRAKNKEGLRGIYVASKSGVKKIISEGDEIETDQGPGKILSNPNFPGFGGEINMNDKGEIVFHCLITSMKDNRELGSAVYVVSPELDLSKFVETH